MQELKNGDVIKVNRGIFMYSHYGIYVDEGGEKSVIHYTDLDGKGKRDSRGEVCETSIEEFLDCADLESLKVCTFKGHTYSGDETVERARSMLGTGDYNIVFNNCEHFAVWCKTGKKESSQVKIVFTGLSSVALLAFAGILAKRR